MFMLSYKKTIVFVLSYIFILNSVRIQTLYISSEKEQNFLTQALYVFQQCMQILFNNDSIFQDALFLLSVITRMIHLIIPWQIVINFQEPLCCWLDVYSTKNWITGWYRVWRKFNTAAIQRRIRVLFIEFLKCIFHFYFC